MSDTTRHIPRGDIDTTRGVYKRGAIKDSQSAPARYTALVSCPGCGQIASLGDHTIAPDGTVTPSLVCAYECGFHEWVTLDGWSTEPWPR